jgi:hypothetical protein
LKELFSISNFKTGWPYIDSTYFALASAVESKQQQYWSNHFYYIGTTHDGRPSAFGVNHGTGHIKASPGGSDGMPMAAKYVRVVRGQAYGANAFVDNGDGTVTDNASGLMWTKDDSLSGLTWEEALAWAEQKNTENYLGYSDWRLPNIKELQSIVDYSGTYPAIDQTYFNITGAEPYFWSSSSAYFSPENPGYYYGSSPPAPSIILRLWQHRGILNLRSLADAQNQDIGPICQQVPWHARTSPGCCK